MTNDLEIKITDNNTINLEQISKLKKTIDDARQAFKLYNNHGVFDNLSIARELLEKCFPDIKPEILLWKDLKSF